MNKETKYLIDNQICKVETRLDFMKDYINSIIEEIEYINKCIEEIDCLVEIQEDTQ